MKNSVIAIVGPTGVGKTKLSVELAKLIGGEIINADSTQVYRGLDIATAKVKEEEKENIPHHLFDIKNIDEDYSVYDYQKDARHIIDDILKRGKTPILVGGTGLYLKAALYDYEFSDMTVVTDYTNFDDASLYQKLIVVDPKTDIHMNNRKRVINALNYFETHKKPFSEKEVNDKLIYPNTFFIGLTCERSVLYEMINNRVEQMKKTGLLEEARTIYVQNIRTKAVMTPIGYKELFSCFDNIISLDEAVTLIKKNSRNYAKRQYTWFNNQIPVKWFEVDFVNFSNTIADVLTYIKKTVL